MTWEIEIENIAGILEGSATIEPGLNAVRGSNWHGKSSFVESIETALGTSTTLTEGASAGRVHLRTPDRDVTVELARQSESESENGNESKSEGSDVRRTGRPYLEDEFDVSRTDLFACLDERNEVRRAVRDGENLEEVLLRPLDFQNIDERIAELNRKRERINAELSQATEAKKRLPAVQEQVQRFETELEELRGTHEQLTGDDDGTGTASRATQGRLAQAQSERDKAKNQIERLERSIERTERRLEERQQELETLEIPDTGDVGSELASARERLQSAKRDLEVLQSVYSTTELVLKEDRLNLLTDVQREITGDEITCWTCGTATSRSDVEERLDELGEQITRLRAKPESYRDRIEELEARREDAEQSRQRKRDLEREITELEERLSDHERSLEDATDRLEDATDRIETLSESVDETVEEITDIESDIKYREAELKDAKDELDTFETRANRVETLEEEHDECISEIETLRNRKDEITHEARTAFDGAMKDVLARFDTGFETARLTSEFDLVVARDGRETSLEALSEGELELLGFVTALAGYESFSVDETVPIMLVDGVGSLDDGNLHTLIDYLYDRAEYLVFTAYPEYTSFEGREITPASWKIVSDRPE